MAAPVASVTPLPRQAGHWVTIGETACGGAWASPPSEFCWWSCRWLWVSSVNRWLSLWHCCRWLSRVWVCWCDSSNASSHSASSRRSRARSRDRRAQSASISSRPRWAACKFLSWYSSAFVSVSILSIMVCVSCMALRFSTSSLAMVFSCFSSWLCAMLWARSRFLLWITCFAKSASVVCSCCFSGWCSFLIASYKRLVSVYFFWNSMRSI
mmetsp:Transcript_27778/g.50132  ORF Transcript_27778/g.50132 Transcript_27778/m.50132 type:complete len:211 (+) Transcript_27778:799-1431(+)